MLGDWIFNAMINSVMIHVTFFICPFHLKDPEMPFISLITQRLQKGFLIQQEEKKWQL